MIPSLALALARFYPPCGEVSAGGDAALKPASETRQAGVVKE